MDVIISDALHVFPTCVGMNRELGNPENQGDRVPHMRGDEPGAQAHS